MGTSLTGKNISTTYLGLLKTTDNAVIGSTAKRLTDGNGTDSPLYLSTSKLGIGVTPTEALTISSGNIQLSNDNKIQFGTSDVYISGTTSTDNIQLGIQGATKLTLHQTTGLTLAQYGGGTITGTVTQRLGVTSAGQVVEIPIGGGAVDGSGTAGKITKWTDSDTIGDSILSESGSTLSNTGIFRTSGGSAGSPAYAFTDATNTGMFIDGGSLKFSNSGVVGLFIDGNNDSTFGGKITINKEASDALKISNPSATNDYLLIGHDASLNSLYTSRAENSYGTHTFRQWDGTTTRNILTLDASQNATFEGNVTVAGLEATSISNVTTLNLPNTSYQITGGSATGDLRFVAPRFRFYEDTISGSPLLQLDGGNATFGGDVIVNGGNLGVGMTPTEVLDIKTTSGDCRMRLDAPTGSDTEVKFFNAGAAQYTIGHDDDSDEFRIATTNVEDPMLSFTKAKNATFAGDVTVTGGDLTLGTDSIASSVNSLGDILSLDVDSDMDGAVSANMQFKISGSEKMRINNTGVGIGTTSPSKILEVDSGTSSDIAKFGNDNGGFVIGYTTNLASIDLSATTQQFRIRQGSSVPFTINGSQNVGIGTTSPATKFVVSNGGASGIEFQPEVVTDTNSISNYDRTASAYMNLRTDALTQQFLISGSEKMRLDALGKVGIGTTNPLNALHVKATTHNAILETSYTTDRSARGTLSWRDASNITGAIHTEYDGTIVSMAFGSLFNSGYNTDTLMTLRGNGNLGIGTTSPSEKLTISASNSGGANNNTLRFVDTDVTTQANQSFGKIEFETKDTNNAGVNAFINAFAEGTGGTGALSFGTGSGGSSERMRITSGGLVGIGCTPDRELDVENATDNSIISAVSSTSHIAGLVLGDTSDDDKGGMLYNNTSDYLYFLSNGSERMRITSAGNVGIGSTNPWLPLLVSSASSTTSFGSDASYRLALTNTDTTNNNFALISFNDGDAGAGVMGLQFTDHTNNYGDLLFITRDSSGLLERMRVTSGGDITVSGGDLFLNSGTSYNDKGVVYFSNERTAIISDIVNATANGDTSLDFQTRTGGTRASAMFIDEFRNVGIGTTSPSRELDVENSADNAIISAVSSASHIAGLVLGDTADDDKGGILYNNTSDYLYFLSNGSERMRIFSNGNVNIGAAETGSSAVTGPFVVTHSSSRFLTSSFEEGTVSLSAKNNNNNLESLRIAGDSIKFFNGTNAVGSQKMVILSSGNVGIGTTSPSEKLEVTGKVRIFDSGYPYIDLGVNTSNYFRIIHDNPNEILKIGKNGATTTSSLILQGPTGNFGIGGVPSCRFDIQGTQGQLFSVTDDLSGEIFAVADISGVPIMTVNSSGVSYFDGKVGIGTASPSAALHVYDSSSGEVKFERVTGYSGLLHFGFPSGLPSIRTSGNFAIKASNTWGADFYINSSGNVGIGTASPQSGGGAASWLSLNGTAAYSGGVAYTIGSVTKAYSYFESDYLKQQAQGGSGQKFIVNGTNTAMTILSSGNVGIGTTSPLAKLQVDNTGLGEFAGANSSSAGGSHLMLKDEGSTSRTLMSGPSIVFQTPANSDGSNIWATSRILGSPAAAGSARGTISLQVRDQYDPFNDGTSWNWRTALTAINTGNVGIGTTSPTAKLHLAVSSANDDTFHIFNGSVRTHLLASESTNGVIYMRSSANTNTVRINSSGLSYFNGGNVGIGVTNPGNKLSVGGSVRINNSGNGQLFFGTGSLNKIELDGTDMELWSGGLVPTITMSNQGLIKFGIYGLGGTGTPNNLLGVDSSGNVVKTNSFNLILDDTPASSTASGNIVNWSVSETVTAGTLYAVKTNGGWTTADADSEPKSTYMLAIALGSNATAGMLLQGFFYKASHGFTIGLPLYISNTAGAFSNSRPTGSGDYVRIIGYATSANHIYFDPDKTWVKLQ